MIIIWYKINKILSAFREYLDLVELCAIHDSLNVLKQLYSIFAEELEDEEIIKYLKEVCTKYGSDSILKFLEERNIDSIDMNKFNEESMVNFFIIFFNFK